MAPNPQQVPPMSRYLFHTRRTNKAPNHVLPTYSRRAASIDSTNQRSHSTRDPVFEPQNSAIPNLRPDPPIRKIVEPPIIDKLRQLCNDRMKHTYDYTHSPGSEPLQLDSASPTASVLHYRPGSKIRRIGSKPPVGINPFRDIYYVPPKGKMTPRNPNESPFLANSFRYSNKAPSAESQPLFRRQATSTIPYRNLAFKRKAQKSFQPVVRQQRSSLSTSTARHSPASTNAPAPEPLDIDEYHQLADTFIDNLVLKLEEIQEERNDVDCEYSVRQPFCFFPVPTKSCPSFVLHPP